MADAPEGAKISSVALKALLQEYVSTGRLLGREDRKLRVEIINLLTVTGKEDPKDVAKIVGWAFEEES